MNIWKNQKCPYHEQKIRIPRNDSDDHDHNENEGLATLNEFYTILVRIFMVWVISDSDPLSM